MTGKTSAPKGWKLVPVRPTKAMLQAGDDAYTPTYTGTPFASPDEVYKAMLKAAPKPTLRAKAKEGVSA